MKKAILVTLILSAVFLTACGNQANNNGVEKANENTNISTQNTQASSDAIITETEARQIALERVPGAADSDIRGFRIERDYGRTKYEGKIYYNNTEYEFEIDASNGKVIEWETDSIG